jgi:hypothetical protein
MSYQTTGYHGVTVTIARPTRNHRLAISPGILGTVYGVNEQREARYFDYDIAGAMAFAGVAEVGADPRLAPAPGRYSYVRTGCLQADVRPGRRYIWVLKDGARKSANG